MVLDTPETIKSLESKGVVAMRADMTDVNPEASSLLASLGNTTELLPFLAVFPADRPNDPHKLDGEYSKDEFLRLIDRLPDSPKENLTERR